MTTVFLVRHAAHDRVHDTLCGRMPGVSLSEAGRAQAERLAERFADAGVRSVRTSPVERARETAGPIARRLGLEPDIDEGLIEIDFGADWLGRRFADLDEDPLWQAWNSRRGSAATAAGETMADVQRRVGAAVDRARAAHPEGAVVLVSHGDVIKGAVAAVLGLSLDRHQSFEVGPASVSALAVEPWGTRLLFLNEGSCA